MTFRRHSPTHRPLLPADMPSGRLPVGAPLPLLPPAADLTLLEEIGIEFALRHGLAPIRRSGAVTLVAGAPFETERCRSELESRLGPVAFVDVPRSRALALIEAAAAPSLAGRSILRTASRESCRNWSAPATAAVFSVLLALAAIAAGALPLVLTGALTLWATVTLISVTGLRTAGALMQLRSSRALAHQWRSVRPRQTPKGGWPAISVLVPLFKERDIAERLVTRLDRLDYPRERLEILLILEADDTTTRDALARYPLPAHISTVTVPPGRPRTKPRAMNYALDFASGDIIGVYDAEDAPAADQLYKVAQAFAAAPPDVACLQGVLDFYNTGATWLTRCFTIDYATWFRLVLPGLVRLGFAIPLGGTTVFFKRDVLEKVGRWDAHNVTEDADLGIRLARRGFRTEFIDSVTHEEATATIPSWVRQRSRWIKGYAITWAVHMREPVRLFRDLGPLRFLGFQVLFLGTLSQFVLAPLLWSFWLVLAGYPHPVLDLAPWAVVVTLGLLFLLAEVATITVAALSVATPRHRGLIWWVPLLHLYFPLSAFACWKAIAELVWRPFYWDKTAHGGVFSRPRARWFRRPPPHPV